MNVKLLEGGEQIGTGEVFHLLHDGLPPLPVHTEREKQ